MFDSEFNYTHVYYHLRVHFKDLILPQREKKHVVEEMERLNSALKLVDLTEMEISLRKYVISHLRKHLEDIDCYVKEKQSMRDSISQQLWGSYNHEMNEFEVGDYGYDYEGPIYPKKPQIKEFDEEEIRKSREAKLAKLDLNDPSVILKYVSVEDGLLGDMLHEYFTEYDLMSDIIDKIKFNGLDECLMRHYLRDVDVYFPDVDILQEGFLLKVLQDDISCKFEKNRPNLDIDLFVCLLILAMEKNTDTKQLLMAYNKAAENNDSLELQRLWFYLSPLCDEVVKLVPFSVLFDKNIINVVIVKYNELKEKFKDKLNTLIKVFLHDKVDKLVYPGMLPNSNKHFPAYDAELQLKPYFHTLELMARLAHKELVEISTKKTKSKKRNKTKKTKSKSSVGKTNVVAGMLCFVISEKPDKSANSPEKVRFMPVPLDFDYNCKLASVDEVFVTTDDLERAISCDLELGNKIAKRSTTLVSNKITEAKNLMQRLIETLDLKNKKDILSKIEFANVESPVTLSYLTSSDISKSTEHRHSERVLNRVLKHPDNVKKIIERIKQDIKENQNFKRGVYTIHSVALLIYSYPNSICDGCGISFLALQNSYEKGFLAEFIKEANKKDTNAQIQLRTRGYSASSQLQVQTEFGITVIAGSKQVFANDFHGKLVKNHPKSKFMAKKESFVLSKPGVNLWQSTKNKNRFFEFTEGSGLHCDKEITVKYEGMFYMSGSKKSKLSAIKRKKLEENTNKVITENQPKTPERLSNLKK